MFEDRKRGSVFEKAFPLELEHDVKKVFNTISQKKYSGIKQGYTDESYGYILPDAQHISFKNYVGKILYENCFGYTRSMEKKRLKDEGSKPLYWV